MWCRGVWCRGVVGRGYITIQVKCSHDVHGVGHNSADCVICY